MCHRLDAARETTWTRRVVNTSPSSLHQQSTRFTEDCTEQIAQVLAVAFAERHTDPAPWPRPKRAHRSAPGSARALRSLPAFVVGAAP